MALARLFLAHAFRHMLRHRTLTLLNVAGIALGVAVFVAIRGANESALRSFRASIDLVAGKADLEVTSEDVRFEETVIRTVWAQPDIVAAAPAVEQLATLADHPGDYLRILGVDLFANAPFRTWRLESVEGTAGTAATFFAEANALAITRGMAERLGVTAGDSLTIRAGGRPHTMRVVFFLEPSDDAVGVDEHLAIMDLAGAQEMFDAVGRLNRIDALMRPGADEAALVAELSRAMPSHVQVRRPERRNDQIERMLAAFQLNLTALSLIALVVGMFLVFNTVSASVVRRRFEIGVLRAIGFRRGDVTALFLLEAWLVGAIGIALGLGFGLVLARSLLGAVTGTISSLYMLLSIGSLSVSPGTWIAGVLLGSAAVVAAAWIPARDAARWQPVEALASVPPAERGRPRVGHWLKRAAWAAGAAVALGLASRGGGPPWLSFGCALCSMMAFSFVIPWLARETARYLRKSAAARKGPWPALMRIGADQFLHALHRNAVAIAALAAALSMMLGLSIMIHSFRTTVGTWLDRSVQADIIVTPLTTLIASGSETLPTAVWDIASATPQLEALNSYREVRIEFEDRLAKVASTDFLVMAERGALVFPGQGDASTLVRVAAARGEALITEAFARKFGLKQNAMLRLATPSGPAELRVAGVFRDYTTSEGLILLDRSRFERLWPEAGVNSVALYLRPDADAEAIRADLRARLAVVGDFLVFSNRALRGQVFRIFDQTFVVTSVLRWIALVVSALGIVLSLTILVLEREREIGLLRAIGASRAQVAAVIYVEGLLIGAIGWVVGTASGVALAGILNHVINVAFFNWTIQWATPWWILWQTPLWLLATCLLAAAWPSWRATRVPIAEAVRSD